MVATGASLVIGGKLDNINLSLILMSSTNSLVYLIYGIGFMKYAGLSISKIIKIFFTYSLICVPLVLVLLIIENVFINQQLQIVVFGTLSFLVFFISLMFSIQDSRNIIIMLWKRVKSSGKQNK